MEICRNKICKTENYHIHQMAFSVGLGLGVFLGLMLANLAWLHISI
jgi:hypothetical protein